VKENYEQKVAREERQHGKFLQQKEERKRQEWWLNLSPKQAHEEATSMDSLNIAFAKGT
jgi:hypothetical protein